MGGSPATGPTQNLGAAAQGMQAAGALLDGMVLVLKAVGPSTPIGQAVSKAMAEIGKHIPPGAVSPQGTENYMKQLMLKQHQMQSQQGAMGMQGAPPGAAPGGPPGGAPPPGAGAPPPSPAG